MELNERINNLGKYLISFNIVDGWAYAIVKIPPAWSVPQTIEEIGVETEKDAKTGGIIFFTQLTNGVEAVFDGIDFVIELNKNLAEKKALMKEKAEELSELFASEPIEKLRTLKFTFEGKKPVRKAKKGKKQVAAETNTETIKEEPEKPIEEVKEEANVEEPVNEISKTDQETIVSGSEETEGSLMSLAMEMIDEE